MADESRDPDGTVSGALRATLKEVLLTGPVTRRSIAYRLEMDPSTISRSARALIAAGLAQEEMEEPGARPSTRGRRFQPLEIDPQGGQVLGIAITPVLQTVALADIGGNIIAGTDFVVEPIGDVDKVVRRIAQESRRLIGTHLEDRSRLLGGLLAVTAMVDITRGSITQCPYLGWGPVPIRAQLADLLNVPMQVRTLANVVAQAELLFGVARGCGNMLGLLCGPGTAAAVLIDGRIVGDSGFPTGGIGMMTVTGEDGTEGTLDDHASGVGILRRLQGGSLARLPLSTLNEALGDAIERDRTGDSPVAAQMARAGRELGRIVVQYGNFVRPEMVVVAGPLALAPSYMAAAKETVEEGLNRGVEVAASSATGAEGGWWATCSMAIHEYLIEQPLDLSVLGPPPS